MVISTEWWWLVMWWSEIREIFWGVQPGVPGVPGVPLSSFRYTDPHSPVRQWPFVFRPTHNVSRKNWKANSSITGWNCIGKCGTCEHVSRSMYVALTNSGRRAVRIAFFKRHIGLVLFFCVPESGGLQRFVHKRDEVSCKYIGIWIVGYGNRIDIQRFSRNIRRANVLVRPCRSRNLSRSSSTIHCDDRIFWDML